MSDSDKLPGVGLDIGTMNIVASRRGPDGNTRKKVRDAFLDVDPGSRTMLKLSKVDFVDFQGSLVIVGDAALKMANLFKREARRPLSKGVISAGELDAQQILLILIEKVTGKPVVDKEKCYYSVPASPIDVDDQDVVYHQMVFKKILASLGYDPAPTNEAHAIIFSECSAENFSGLAVSFGAGMCNVALSYQAAMAMDFSVARGGDWIDSQSAKAVGKTASQMCAIKERGIETDIVKRTRDEEAISMYTGALIEYALKNIAVQFKKVRGQVDLPEPIPFIVSGGTTKINGFMDVFHDEFDKINKNGGFPIKISEIRAAKDPLTAVSDGLLVLAESEYDEE